MSFKAWVTPLLQEMFVPGSHYNLPKDITNVGMGVRSKYISPEEAGVGNDKSVDTADFGMDTQEEIVKSKRKNKLLRLKDLRKAQRRNDV